MREESSPFVGPSRRLGSRPGECSVLEAAYIIIIRGDKGKVWVWPGVATEGCRVAAVRPARGVLWVAARERASAQENSIADQKKQSSCCSPLGGGGPEEHEGEEGRPSP